MTTATQAGTCLHGHPRTPENISTVARQTICLPCDRERGRRAREAEFAQRHAGPGHHITRDAIGRRRCTTCHTRAGRGPADDIAVERAVAGDRPPDGLTHTERVEAILRLRRRGLSAAATARRCGCSRRTVERIWARYGRQRKEVAA